MPNLTSKKIKTINSSSLIKNQITNILQPVNGSISIKQPNNTILTQNAVSQNYYIPLLEKITGEQSITTRVPLSFNATTNTLSVPNLTISNLPTCNVDASNSSDLVRKSYANTYAYFDLAAGDRWYCEDWITGTTKGKFNWDLSANNGDTTTQIFMFDSCANFIGTHIGILGISSRLSQGFKQVKLPIIYNSNKMKSMRFIVTLFNGQNTTLRIGFFDNYVSNSNNNFYWGYDITSGSDSTSGYALYINNTKKLWLSSNNYPPQTYPDSSLNIIPGSNQGKWVLLEIEQTSSNYLNFYMTNLTSNGNRIRYSINDTKISSYDGNIYIYYSVNSSSQRTAYIDYIDWVVSS